MIKKDRKAKHLNADAAYVVPEGPNNSAPFSEGPTPHNNN